VPLGRLDGDFARFARERAHALAPTATWVKPEPAAQADPTALAEWLKENPRNVPALKQHARQLLRVREFKSALDVAKRLDEIFPDDTGSDNAQVLMAAAYRGLNDVDSERAALEKLAIRAADATPAYLRLMEISAGKGDWNAVLVNAERMLAVNPLVPAPHRYLAQAAEKLGNRDKAIRAYQALLLFDTTDTTETHFRLAQLLRDVDERAGAKLHVLMALEEAPRFLGAHKLLLELTSNEDTSTAADSSTEPADK
jgi:tetratricopeptide (TPR) repeat protein